MTNTEKNNKYCLNMYCSFFVQVSLYSRMWGKGHQVKSARVELDSLRF